MVRLQELIEEPEDSFADDPEERLTVSAVSC